MADLSKVKNWIKDADSIIVTAGNGMAISEGLDILSEKNFDQDFPQIAKKYHVHTIADALDKKFDSWTETWLFWSKLINKYSINYKPSSTMKKLKKLLDDKDNFIATSTFGHFFEKAGFNSNRVFDAAGDWTVMQCSSGINHGQKNDLDVVKKFMNADQNGNVVEDLVPRCDDCNSEMEIHVPLNAHFFPDTNANTRFRWFLTGNEDKKVVILELGVDETSPQLLDPMIKLVEQFSNWKYVAADLTIDELPDDLAKRSFALGENSEQLLVDLTN